MTIESAYHGRTVGVASALYLSSAMNANRLRETKTVRVDERYSTAREWQKAMSSGKKRKEKTVLISQHYKETYGENNKNGQDISNEG